MSLFLSIFSIPRTVLRRVNANATESSCIKQLMVSTNRLQDLIEHVCPSHLCLSPPSRKLVLLRQVECHRLPKLDLADVTGEEVIDAADMVDSMDIP